MKIFITRRAEKNYRSIKKYLLKEWGTDVVTMLDKKTLHLFDLLERFPKLGTVENSQKGIRGLLLTSQIRIFYRIKDEKIIILSFFDVRQNMDKRNF